jgi:transcriptional regulator with XRE-family HTH domain
MSEPRVGPLLRDWRQRRRLSQLDLALAAGISARQLSFVETGRSRPSADMVLLLAEHLEVPLRARNELLLLAGHAPRYAQQDLDAPEMQPVREVLDTILRGHEPNPALVVDRHWEMLAANAGVGLLIEGVAPHLLEPPVNALRLALAPDGLAPRIANLGQWRGHLLERLGRQAVVSGDPALAALHEELAAYPGAAPGEAAAGEPGEIAVPLRLRTDHGELAFISTVTAFGTATEVTLSELAVETFFPADAATAAVLREQVERLSAVG